MTTNSDERPPEDGVPGTEDRTELAKAIHDAVNQLAHVERDDALQWGTETVDTLADLLAAALPLWDSAMAVMALNGADWTTVAAHAGITAQQASRRSATTPELEHYARQVGTGARRVSRDAIAVARNDLKHGRLLYGGGHDGDRTTKRLRRT